MRRRKPKKLLSTYVQAAVISRTTCEECGAKGRMQVIKTVEGGKFFCKQCCHVQEFIARRRRNWNWHEPQRRELYEVRV